MPTRRDFLKQTTTAGMLAATSVRAGEEVLTGAETLGPINRTTRGPASRIKAAARREETILSTRR